MKREADLYPLVASWLRRRGHCFAVGINKGLRYSRMLGLGRCQICDCVFQTGTPEDRFSRVTRENVRLALRANRGVMFWNHLVGPRKLKLRRNSPGRFTTFERRFICPDCVDFLAYVTREFQEVQA